MHGIFLWPRYMSGGIAGGGQLSAFLCAEIFTPAGLDIGKMSDIIYL